MHDSLAVVRVVGQQNNAQFIDIIIQPGYSNQAFLIQGVPSLKDGTPSFKDLLGHRNNRFTSLEAASKNRIPPPMNPHNPLLLYYHHPKGAVTGPGDGGEDVGFAAHNCEESVVNC